MSRDDIYTGAEKNRIWKAVNKDMAEQARRLKGILPPNPDTPVDGLKFDVDKPRFSLIPPFAEVAVVEVLEFGAQKYDAENWRKVEGGKQRYLDAALRHINAHRQGLDKDRESGLHPLAHAIASLLFVLELDL